MIYPIRIDFENFIKTHFVLPFTLLILLFIGLEFTSLDFDISKHFYNTKLQQWPYRDSFLTQTIFHKGGQIFSKFMGGLVLVFLLFSLRSKSSLNRFRKPLFFLFISSVTGPAIIAILKSNTYIYCPWDLTLFGGSKPYTRLFDFTPINLSVGHCFPAGHAGGGYAFLSLYFFLLIVKPEYKYYGLYTGLLLGLIYGVTQQMRGAHFLSHDVFALAVCWLASLTWFLIIFRKDLQWV